jgi:carbohydrate-binding DOMON domain-containing protein
MRFVPFALAFVVAMPALGATVKLKDPAGDDNGPGSYVYPTKAEYKKGSFDIREVKIAEKGANLEISIEVGASIEDPWDSKKWPSPGNGFSLQMFQIYVDTDGKKGSGHDEALPGMNATFADDSRWEKVIVIGAHSSKKVKSEVDAKAGDLAKDVVLPKKVSASGKIIKAVIAKKDLGKFKLNSAGWQVLSASAEGYPKDKDILSRRVNEFEGEHRFGGGDDGMSDPHFVDVVAGKAKGDASEVKAQHDMLKYDAAKGQKAVLSMVRP